MTINDQIAVMCNNCFHNKVCKYSKIKINDSSKSSIIFKGSVSCMFFYSSEKIKYYKED